MLRFAPRRQRMLLQWQPRTHFVRPRGVSFPRFRVSSTTIESSAVRVFHFPVRPLRAYEMVPIQRNVLNYWQSAALAAGACGALILLDEQQPVVCAASTGDEDDPLEQAKKRIQELSTIAIAHCTARLPEDFCSNVQKNVDKCLASGNGGPMAGCLCMGACTGFALKKMSKLGVATVGTLFIMLQGASYAGYVDVDYKKLEWDLKKYLDMDQRAAFFETKDSDSMPTSLWKMLEGGLPAGSGFAVGFILGFRLG